MKRETICLAAIFAMASAVHGQVIIADNYNVAGSGTGFNLNTGANSGVNPPTTTRLAGSDAADLRYYTTAATKAVSSYSITGGKLQVASAAIPGQFTLSPQV
jgi:hypothetical protein